MDDDDAPRFGRRPITPVAVTRAIAADATDVWAAVSAPGNLEHAHPFCARNPVSAWPGPDSRDEVHYLSGWVYRREFTEWFDGAGYDLRIGSDGEQRSDVSWRITSDTPGRADLTIRIRARPLDRLPRVMQGAARRGYVEPRLRRYLDSVLRGFEWWVTTGDPVAPNQFGRHPWFSER